jgi:hypothetical protein
MSSTIQYSLVETPDISFITLIVPGLDSPLTATSAQDNWQAIIDYIEPGNNALAVEADSEDFDIDYLVGLFDLTQAVAAKFENLSERVTVAHGRVFFDGDEVETALTKQIARFLAEGVEDWKPLVAFFEKVQQNPNEHSRTQLYNWLEKHDFTITEDGDIVGYKGVNVRTNAEGEEEFISVHSGVAVVDGVKTTGQIPNKPGSVITMPRASVQHDPTVGCHRGLHVGTYQYASTFGQRLLEVKVNPRDVVSVPTQSSWQKVRTCRYEVVGTLVSRYEAPLKRTPLDVDGSGDDDAEYIITIDIDVTLPSEA